MFNILIVEDDENTRKYMIEVLKNAGYRTFAAKDGLEALDMMEHQQLDLAIVDVMMPRMDGYAFTNTLREGKSEMPVLMVTALVNRSDMQKGFLSGIDDYMTKPVDEEEMLWRVAALLRRARAASERKLTIGSTTLDYDSFQALVPGKTIQLSPKEFQLLFRLLSRPGTMLTKRQILDEIWDMDSEVDEHAVEMHIYRLREKFKDSIDFEIRTIRGFGYMGVLKENENA